MIGIIGAMDIEVDGIKSLLHNTYIKTVSGINFVCGSYRDKNVVVAKCGIGKVFAALCAEAMINNFSPAFIINTGVAGSLTNELSTTDAVVSSAVVQYDMDTSAIGDPVGLISGINLIEIKSDEILSDKILNTIKSLKINCKKGIIASGDRFVADIETKHYIKNAFSASACEMEGAAIGQVCYVNKVPFVIVRTISDNADGTSEADYPVFVKKASANSVKIIEKFLSEYR